MLNNSLGGANVGGYPEWEISPTAEVVFYILYGLIFLLGTTGNIAVITTIRKKRTKQPGDR